jgi:hypothetical protein
MQKSWISRIDSSWYHPEPHASSLRFQNSIFLSTPSSHPVYASVDPDGHPDIYHTFLERPFQPILSRDHREEFSKRSPTVAIRYDEPGQRIIQRFVSVGREHSATKSTCTHEAESPRRQVFTLTVRFQLESPRATISSSYSEGKNCLRCEGMSWSHGQLVRTRFLRLGRNPLSVLSSLAHELELCLACFSLLGSVYPYPLRNTSISHNDTHQLSRCRI